jgi:hypothetical protein
MPDPIIVLGNTWKKIIGISIIMAVIAFVISLIFPKQYLSTSTALPVNSLVADRARIFNQHIDGLYSSIGSADELDKIEGTSKLDTLYLSVIRNLNLTRHYHLSSGAEGEMKAVLQLRRNSDISKTGYGELRIKVLDKDRNMAANICNDLMDQLQRIQSNVLSQLDSIQYSALIQNKKLEMSGFDSSADDTSGSKNTLPLKSKNYNQLLDEFRINLSLKTPALLIVEKARPALWADKPDLMKITLFTFFGSLLFFTLLFYLNFEKR